MKIALLMDAPLRKQIISEKIINKMKEISDVSMNETSTTDEKVIMKVIQDADIAVTSWGNTIMTKEILDCAPKLKLVAHAAGSVKPIVSEELFNRGIKVISCAEVLGKGVAETALGLTISTSKNFYNLNNDIANGKWNEHYSDIKELFELKVGVIGCGYAGTHYIHLMKNFDVEIIASDPYLSAEQIAAKGAVKVELEELLRVSDIISIHAPLNQDTQGLINYNALNKMKKSAILINMGRGPIVIEGDLAMAIDEELIAGAALDVFEVEPIKEDNPLTSIKNKDNLVLTPHIAWASVEARERLFEEVIKNIKAFYNGEIRGRVEI